VRSWAGLDALEAYEAPIAGPIPAARAEAVRRLACRLRLAMGQVGELTRQINDQAAERFAPFTQICGVNFLTAGTLAGILGPGRRFTSEAQLAAYAGVAPLEASSAGHVRHRLNRLGNRRLNAVLYRIALTQARVPSAGQRYVERRIGEGKTRREAVRALKRHLVRPIWRCWQECLDPDPTVVQASNLAA
jgi:transposase